MYDAGSGSLTDVSEAGAVVEKCIDQRARVMTRGRMCDEAGLLVDHHEAMVFIAYVDLYWLRLGASRRWRGNTNLDAVSGLDPVPGLPFRPPDPYVSFTDQRRGVGSR